MLRCVRILRGCGPLDLVFNQAVGTHGDALRLERLVKALPRSAKLALVAGKRGLPQLAE